MVVYPEGVWYCGLTEKALDRIVDGHLLGGGVVEEHARGPGRHEHVEGRW
jgi:(2Fe-2S) ferredoxin